MAVFNNKRKQLGPQHNINDKISHSQVRLVGDDIKSDIYSIQDALAIAEEMGVDLVEINSTTNPPICRVIDYQKFLYEKKKKDKENKKNTTTNVTKEVRLSPNISDNDFNTKLKQSVEFLKDGFKVKVQLQFKGRGIVYKDQGELVMLKFAQQLADFGKVEQLPKLEGNRMLMFVAPKKK